MSDFIQRLFAEKKELDERIAKLQSFKSTEAFDKIEPFQRSLLNVQLNAMATYSQCLDERIVWLSPQSNS